MQADVRTVKIEGSAFAELYATHAREALRLAYLLTGDAALAEDLVHDAFVRLAGRLFQFRDPQSFGAYLRRTIVNLSRSHHRRRAVERRFLERQEEPPVIEQPELADREQLRRALLTLPLRQRTAIVLRYYEDLSEAGTAELMRCRPSAVRSLVFRGMQTLRANLEVSV